MRSARVRMYGVAESPNPKVLLRAHCDHRAGALCHVCAYNGHSISLAISTDPRTLRLARSQHTKRL